MILTWGCGVCGGCVVGPSREPRRPWYGWAQRGSGGYDEVPCRGVRFTTNALVVCSDGFIDCSRRFSGLNHHQSVLLCAPRTIEHSPSMTVSCASHAHARNGRSRGRLQRRSVSMAI